MTEEKINSLFLSKRKLFNTWAEQVYDFLSVNKHTHTHTHTSRLADISQALWLWVFISLSFSFFSFIILSPRAPSPPAPILSFSSSLIVFHHLSIAPLFCCSFKLIAFLSVSFSFISTLSRLLCLSPSGKLCLYFSRLFLQMSDSVSALRLLIHREKVMGREWRGEREKGSDKERSRKRDAEGGMGEWYESCSSEKAGIRWEKERKSRTKSEKGRERESLQYFNHSFSQITEQPQTLSSFLAQFYPSLPLCSPQCLLIVQISPCQLKYRYQDKKNNSRWRYWSIIRQAEKSCEHKKTAKCSCAFYCFMLYTDWNHLCCSYLTCSDSACSGCVYDLPAHLVRVMSGGPGLPVPPSPGLVSKTLISYSVSGSRCHNL